VKVLARIGLILGLCVTITLVAETGALSILHLLSQAGWWLPWLVPLRALPLLLDVTGWRALIAAPCRLHMLFLIAAIREAINRLFPVANVGGEVVGVHLLMRQHVPAPVAAASVIVETMLTLMSQYIFAAMGLLCLVSLKGHAQVTSGILLSLGLSLPIIIAFAMLLKNGSIFSRLERIAAKMFSTFSNGDLPFKNWALLDGAIRGLLESPRRLLTAAVWQLLGLIAGCFETWLIMRWLGQPVPFTAAIALESLTQAARSIFFMVPAGLGVQEMGLIGLGSLIGINAEVAISLSLAKRLREILFGLPALAIWQRLEKHNLAGTVRDGADT
jgi:putative membrane protein